MIYLILICEFFKTGLFAIGGGLATLPFLYDLADKYGWYTAHELADMLAVSESTPGAIGINMATYAGIKTAGIPGGIIATLAIICPSIIVICIIAKVLDKFNESRLVKTVMGVIKPAATGLVGAATISIVALVVFKTTDAVNNWLDNINILGCVLTAICLAAVLKWKKHPIVYIAAMAVIGIVLGL